MISFLTNSFKGSKWLSNPKSSIHLQQKAKVEKLSLIRFSKGLALACLNIALG